MSTQGDKIIKILPDRSALKDPTNPGNIMVEDAIGVELDSANADLETNSNARFLTNATGAQLDLFGDWFGIPRAGKSDDEYRTLIMSLRSANITLSGLKGAIATILGISVDQITVINGDVGCFRYGSSKLADHYSGVHLNYAGHYKREPGVITIILPAGSDLTLIEIFIQNIILPGVMVWFEEE